MSIMEPKVQATSGLVDVLFLGLAKSTTERLLSPFIGNGTLKSGVIKGVGGGLISNKGGKIGNTVSSALVIDGVEDVITSLLSGTVGAAENRNEDW